MAVPHRLWGLGSQLRAAHSLTSAKVQNFSESDKVGVRSELHRRIVVFWSFIFTFLKLNP